MQLPSNDRDEPDGSLTASRRRILRTTGAAGAASLLPFAGVGRADHETTVDDALDPTDDSLQETLVVFERNDDVDRLRHLDLANGYHKFEVLPVGYTELTGSQIETVADWTDVRYVQANIELDYHNDDAREDTRADAVQADLGYTGESVHTVVIDSGVDGDHPDLDGTLAANWRWVGNPLESDAQWEEVGDVDTDDNGHGTHTSGSVSGDGTQSDGEYTGMAPDSTLTVYSAGAALFILYAVAAFDHMIARKRAGETDVQVVSNSYGSSSGDDFNPDDALNVASWYATEEGILTLFSAGNAGPDPNTLNDYAKAPNVLSVAATDDETAVTDFSSRGRTPDYDGATNYKRKKALDNLRQYRAADKTDEEVESGSFSGTVAVDESEFHEWNAPSKAGYVEATLSWEPSAEDIDFYLHEGSPDGEVVASSATLNHPEELSGPIEGGTTYYFEVRPFANVAADYDVEFTAYEGINRNVHPMGLYRNGVGANGNLVMSTLEPTDPLQAYAEDTETWYGRISGTSMSCPVTAGVATLVVDAYQQNVGESPDPIDVLNTVEAEAEDARDGYNPWNIGAGFVDAYDAVARAEDGDLATFGEVKLADE
jgi:serine protease AprX